MLSVKLRPIKQILWERIKNKIESDDIPHSDHIEFIYKDNTISTRLEIIQNKLVGLLDIDVFIESLPVKILDKTGFVDIVFSIPTGESCSIDKISIENWSEALDDIITELEDHLISDWNS